MQETFSQSDLLSMAVQLSSAYLSHNKMEREDIPLVFETAYRTVHKWSHSPDPLKTLLKHEPAVPISESVTDDYLVCLEDGKKLQMLKRHLNTVYNMTVDQYKERWNLPKDYPAVSPTYAKRRSEIAKNTGLGLSGRKQTRTARAA